VLISMCWPPDHMTLNAQITSLTLWCSSVIFDWKIFLFFFFIWLLRNLVKVLEHDSNRL